MFVVFLDAVPTPSREDFGTTAGVEVTVFTNMITEEDAVQVARYHLEQDGWSILRIVEIGWAGDEAEERSPFFRHHCNQARQEGAFYICDTVPLEKAENFCLSGTSVMQ